MKMQPFNRFLPVLMGLALLPACRSLPPSSPSRADTTITATHQVPEDEAAYRQIRLLTAAMMQIRKGYVDASKTDYQALVYGAMRGMLESLDPYTNFIPESEVEDYKFITTGQYGGIGAPIHQQGDYVVISEPYEGSPAQKSDLRAGDKIYQVNGQVAKGKTYDEVSAILKGQAGTTVTLQVLRDGVDQPIEKTITRENIKIENIPFTGMVADGIGYIKLNSFIQNAGKEVKQAFL